MASRQVFPVVVPEERRGSPHSPQLTHTHRGHQVGEVGRAGARCPSEPRAPRPRCAPLPGKGGRPSTPKSPATPFSGGDRHQAGHGHQAKSPLLSPGQASPGSGGSAPTVRAVSGVWQRRAEQGAPTLTVTGGASSSHLPSCFLAF